MADLERALASLELDWPATPAFDLRRPARRRWPFAVAALAAAVGVAFAVPPARSAILRFLHLRGVSIERVRTLPAAEQRSLASTLGVPVSATEARQLLGRPFGLRAQLYRSGQAVSALVAAPDPVLVTEIRYDVDAIIVMKKVVSGATATRWLTIDGVPAVWITGAAHVVELPPSAPRLAGNVLVFTRRAVVYRIEGKTLTLDGARAIASRIAG